MSKIKLDLSRDDVIIRRGDGGKDSVRYIQDGVPFTASGKVVGDEKEFLAKKAQAEIKKAEEALKAAKSKLEADIGKAKGNLEKVTSASKKKPTDKTKSSNKTED